MTLPLGFIFCSLFTLQAFAQNKAPTMPMQTRAMTQAQQSNQSAPQANLRGTNPPPAQAPRAEVSPPATSESPMDSLLNEDLIRTLRDPFQLPSILMTRKDNPKTDLETYQLKDFHLNGVITGPKKTRAMLTAPGNKVYFVRIGDKIGLRDGKITQILPDGIKIIEYSVDEHGKKIPDTYELMITGDLVSLNKKEE